MLSENNNSQLPLRLKILLKSQINQIEKLKDINNKIRNLEKELGGMKQKEKKGGIY